jgi:hypothetical protein
MARTVRWGDAALSEQSEARFPPYCMQGRLNAVQMHNERGSHLNLVGVVVCALVSAFANVASSLQGYNPVNLDHTPPWIQTLAPWSGMIFPLLIVVLSMTMDHLLDHTSANGIDVATFRAQERRRVEFLQARLETEKELYALEKQLSDLRGQRAQTSGKATREWVFLRWLRPSVPAPVASGPTVEESVERAMQAARATLDEQLHTFAVQVETWMNQMNEHLYGAVYREGTSYTGDEQRRYRGREPEPGTGHWCGH